MYFEHAKQALERVDANIRAANEQIRRQAERIEEMQREGFDTSLARRALAVMCDARAASVEHRELILERINLVADRSRYQAPVMSLSSKGALNSGSRRVIETEDVARP